MGVAMVVLLSMGAAPGHAAHRPEDAVDRALVHAPRSPVDVNARVNVRVDSVRATAMVSSNGATTSMRVLDPGESVVRSKPDGAQMLTVLSGSDSLAEFALSLPTGWVLDDSGAGFTIESADGRLTYGAVEAPWAIDAAGRSLPSRYTLAGTILTQHVNTAGAAYPIVADPKPTFGSGVYLNLWGAEIKTLYSAVMVAGGAASVATCVLDKVPTSWKPVTKLLCLNGLTPTSVAGVASLVR